MKAAALLPLVVLVGALVAITQGAWPTGLAPTIGLVAMLGGITIGLMDRLVTGQRHS